jgi:dipeptidyl-peptidase-4
VTVEPFPVEPTDSFPRQYARTRRFSLGRPRTFAVAEGGSRVAFLRSRASDDPVGCLWVFDVATSEERLVFDPATGGDEHLSPEERDRRERRRESLIGVTDHATDRAARVSAFAMDGGLYLADLIEGGARRIEVGAGDPFDPRPDPSGVRIAYVSDGALRVVEADGTADRELASDPDPDVRWGEAEFVAAEEMDRLRGFWWSPEGDRIVAARVDDRPVRVWHIASPVDPEASPRAVRYPRAGTDNAIVTLAVLDLDGGRVDVDWDRGAFEYLVSVGWASEGPLTIVVQSRDQRRMRILAVDPDTGATRTIREDRDDRWLDIVGGVPGWLPDGRLVRTLDVEDTKRIAFDDEPMTPPGLQVVEVLDVGEHVVFRGSEDPTEIHVYRLALDGTVSRLTGAPGVHTGAVGGDALVLTSATMDALPTTRVVRGGEEVATLGSFTEEPLLIPRPTFLAGGERTLRMAMFTPDGAEPSGKLPVLLDPYGGPHFGVVQKAMGIHFESQWFADRGFAVLAIDGRGTPNRGPEWDRAVYRNLADPVLEDQVDGLHAAAERFPFLDLDRVAIRGWSFGGFLAAMAVLRRPDVFHAAVSGAPVTDGTFYDTHYTERYLGLPDEEIEAYARYRLLDDAPNLSRPLMLIHGLADDNVYVANTLALSKALMEAGRPHTVLPLSGITHAPLDPAVAENLLMLQVRFLRDALGMRDRDPLDR